MSHKEASSVSGKFKFPEMTTKSGYILCEFVPGVFIGHFDSVRRTFCMDCGDEDPFCFVVKDEVWKEAGLNRGMICWFCFEKRLGRKLRRIDLKKPHPPNHPRRYSNF